MANLYRRALRTFDTSTLTGSPQNLGAIIPFPVSKVSIVNTSTVGVIITDGSSNDGIEVPGGSTLSIGEGLNNTSNISTKFIFPDNVQLQIEQVTGSASGKLIINAFG